MPTPDILKQPNQLAAGSVVSYPERGPWGDKSWRGNTSGWPLVDMFKWFRPRLVVDPMMGSDTTGDVCRTLGVDYVGLDLHSGFNAMRDSLRGRLEKLGKGEPDFIFVHPPYGDMITYSGNVWGRPHEDDLSRCASAEEFIGKMERVLWNCYEALPAGGRYSVMVADHRVGGEYRCYAADLMNLGIGKLENVIVKVQHNCTSNRRSYAHSFIPIRHEYVVIWSKEAKCFTIGQVAFRRSLKLSRQWWGTWRAIVLHGLRELGGQASVKDLYQWVFQHVDTTGNLNVEAKVRQTLQYYCERIGRGVYREACA